MVSAMVFGILAQRCGETKDALGHQLAFGRPGTKLVRPMARGVDTDALGSDGATPVGDGSRIARCELSVIMPSLERSSVETLARAANVDAGENVRIFRQLPVRLDQY